MANEMFDSRLRKNGKWKKVHPKKVKRGDIILMGVGKKASVWIALKDATREGWLRCEPIRRIKDYLRKTRLD